MKITASTTWNNIAKSIAKELSWTVHIRLSNSLTGSISDGMWTNVTDKVVQIPTMKSNVEYEVGQFSSDSITLNGNDIDWWNTNIFSAADKYVECKVQLVLSQGSSVATDTLYTAHGYIDRYGLRYDELSDNVQMTAYTVQDIGSRIAAEYVTTQYVEPYASASISGLILPQIPGMYLMSTTSSKSTNVGAHTITYDYNAGSREAQLDTGRLISLSTSNANYTLGNGDTEDEDTEQVTVYVPDLSLLLNTECEDSFVVLNKGDRLPYQWHTYAGARHVLTTLFTQLGIATSSMVFDDLEIDTAYPADGSYKVSFVDYPPNNALVNGKRWALTTDGTDLYTAVGNKVYKRTIATDTYTQLTELPSEMIISRLMYADRPDDLWICYGSASNYDGQNDRGGGRLRRWNAGSGLSGEVILNATADAVYHNSMQLIDVTGSVPVYGLVYTDVNGYSNGGQLCFVTGSDLSKSTIYWGSTWSLTGNSLSTIVSRHMHIRNGNEVWFKAIYDIGLDELIKVVYSASSGTWANEGVKTNGLQIYSASAYQPTEDRIYYYHNDSYYNVRSHHITGSATLTHLQMPIGAVVDSLSTCGEYVYWTMKDWGDPINDLYLYRAVKTSNLTYDTDYIGRKVHNSYGANYAYVNGRVYGIDWIGRLWQYYNKVKFFASQADFSGMSVTDALNSVLQAYNLVGTINSMKKAIVYKRSESDGTPRTSGNTLSLTISDVSALNQSVLAYPKVSLVTVTNGTTTVNYNGTDFNSAVLSDERTFSLSNELVSDDIIYDIAVYLYNHFSVDRSLYTIECGVLPYFQYEPLDNCNVTFASTKIQKTISGDGYPIYGISYAPDGTLILEIIA